MVLSGFKTQALNIWANSAELFGEFLVSSTQDPRNTALLAKGVLNGMRKGWLESRAILGSKHGSIRGAKIDVPSTLEDIRFKGGAFNPFNYVKYVGRFMDAADTFFFASAKEMRFNQLAAVEARRMKKTDPDISIYKKVSEMLYNDKQGLEDARSAAAAEGLTGLNFKRRVFEIMEQNRDSNMSEDSQDFAARATFNYDPEGSMAIIISAINQLQKIPGFRFIVPFSRIVGNVTNRYLDWTPIGAVRVIKGGIGWGSLMKEYNKEERIRTAIKATISTVLVAALYNFIEDDDDFEITAGGTGDYKKNYELEAGSGWQEYSIRIGDTWYSYKNTPLAIAFAFLGDISDRKKYLGQNDRDVFDSVSGSFLSSGKYIMSQSFLLGFSDFLSIFTDKSKREEFGVKKLLSFPVKSVKGVMIPALFTQSKRFYDEYSGTALKQPTAWYEDIYKDIPFFNDGMGNKYNALGDKVIPDITKDLMPFSMKSAEGDKVFELLTSNGMYVGTPQSTVYKSSSNSSIKLKAEGKEYNKYAMRSGKLIKRRIMEDYGKLVELSKKDKKAFEKEVNKIKKEARAEIRFEMFGRDIKDLKSRER